MAKKGTGRSAEREAKWREIIARQAASGLSVREFCQRDGLREPSFYGWRRTLAQRDAEAAGADRPAFLPIRLPTTSVTPSAANAASSAFALELRGGRTLRLPESLSVERLAAIVRAIEQEVSP